MQTIIHYTIILIIMSASITEGESFHTVSEMADLVIDIKQHYKSDSLFFVYSVDHDNIRIMTLLLQLTRMLSERNYMTAMLDFKMMKVSEMYYHKRIGRPLVVVIITSNKYVEQFQVNTAKSDLVPPFWLIIFWDYTIKLSHDYCKHPVGNPFNPNFDSELLIKCYDDKNIYEWYSIYKNKTEVRHFATWDSKNRLNLTLTKELYMRRNQIGGVRLKVAAIKGQSMKKGIPSLVMKTVQELSLDLNFTIKYDTTEFSIGNYNYSTHEWSGVIKKLHKGEVDLAIAATVMTSKRLETVDFLQPLILTHAHLYIRKPETTTVEWIRYFQTFSYKVWYCIIAFLVITPIFISFIKLKSKELNVSYKQLLYDSYFYVWGIYCQQGLTEDISTSSLRLAYSSIFISSWIILSLYSAYLISYLTLPSINMPFNDLEGFVADGTYKLIVVRNSDKHALFQTTNDPILKKMHLLLKNVDDLPMNVEDAFDQVCNEKVAFFTNQARRESVSPSCSVVEIETGRIDSIAIAVSKHNPYLGAMKFHLQRFLESGKMRRYKKRYLLASEEFSRTEYIELGLQGVAPILAIILGGIGFALLIFMFEKLYSVYFYNEGNLSFPKLFSRQNDCQINKPNVYVKTI